LLGVTRDPFVMLLGINVVLLILGCFMEGLSLIIILVPIILPLVTALGVDPVHFCVLFVLNTTIGTITPPFGVIMFAMIALAKTTMAAFSREAWPFITALVLVLLTITVFPPLVTWLPSVLMGAAK